MARNLQVNKTVTKARHPMPVWHALTGIFDKRITLGNLVTIGAMLVMVVLWYGKVSSHIDNNAIHPTPDIREAEIDKRTKELMAPVLDRLGQLESNVNKQFDKQDLKIDANTALLNQIKGAQERR